MRMLLIEGMDACGKSTRIKLLAKHHAEWVCSLVNKVYVDAFIHGYGHAKKDEKKKRGVRR